VAIREFRSVDEDAGVTFILMGREEGRGRKGGKGRKKLIKDGWKVGIERNWKAESAKVPGLRLHPARW